MVVAVAAVVLLQEEKQVVVVLVQGIILGGVVVTPEVIRQFVNSPNSSSLSSLNIILTIDIIILL